MEGLSPERLAEIRAQVERIERSSKGTVSASQFMLRDLLVAYDSSETARDILSEALTIANVANRLWEKHALAAEKERDQLRVQLAGCSVATKGGKQDVFTGDYGWSASYQDVVELRKLYDQLRAENERQKHLLCSSATTYNVYESERRSLFAIPAGEDGNLWASREGRLVATVEAVPYRRFTPDASAFQSDMTDEYIATGLSYPRAEAVVTH